MTILTADHLFEQSERLIALPAAGPRRQADLRRAISAAYYGLFHFGLMSVADEFVGVTQRATVRYALVYRSVDHRTLKATCVEARKQKPSAKYAAFTPLGGFDEHIREFSAVAVDLQELRHTADYDPQPRFKMSDARRAINNARSAVRQFPMASQDHRKAFLTLLLCPPR